MLMTGIQDLNVEPPPPPPVEVEEMEGGTDGIFMTKSLLFNHSDPTFVTRKELAIRDTAQIFISMRARTDRPIKTDQEEHMIFGPMSNSVHQLKRNDGLGPQYVSSDELASYSNPGEALIIAVEYEIKEGAKMVLKYRSMAKALSTLYSKHTATCKQLSSVKTPWSSYKQSP